MVLYLLPGFAQADVHIHLLLAAVDRDSHRIAGAMVVHDLRQILLVLDSLAVNSDDQVAPNHNRNIAEIRAFRPAT